MTDKSPLLASDIAQLPQRWLIKHDDGRGILPLGAPVLLTGRTGASKSLHRDHMIACITAAQDFADDCEVVHRGHAMLFNSEQSIERTAVPRVEAASADLTRLVIVPFFDKQGSSVCTTYDDVLREVREHCQRVKDATNGKERVRLVMVDVLTDYGDVGAVNPRRVVPKFRTLAEQEDLTFVFVVHLREKSGVANTFAGMVSGKSGWTQVCPTHLWLREGPQEQEARRP